MLKNYLFVGLRALRRQPGYAAINVLGLSVGLACSFFILLWVSHEASVDRFHEKGDRIYRVMRATPADTWMTSPFPLAAAMEDELPEVVRTVPVGWSSGHIVRAEDATFRESARFVGPSFFEVFSFPLLAGDAATVLDGPASVALSESAAARLFGAGLSPDAVVGETVELDGRKDFRVSGVFADIPETSSIGADVLLPIEDFRVRNAWLDRWTDNGLVVYAELAEGADPEAVDAQIAGWINDRAEAEPQTPFLHRYADAYLYGEFEGTEVVGGRIDNIRVFVAIALFLLLIAAINFMNLATARSGQRAGEIGVRKAIGAGRKAIAGQFLLEAMLLSAVSFVVALVLVALLLPAFSTLTGIEVTLGTIPPLFFGVGAGIALLVGLAAGSYPALYLASFRPVAVLRGTLRQGRATSRLRQGLVVFQFALSTLLVVGTAAVYVQMEYIQTKELGLDRENIIFTTLEGNAREQREAFQASLEGRPGIEAVTASNQNPTQVGNSTQGVDWPGKAADDNTNVYMVLTDHGFVETMGMTMAAGRTFSPAFASDSSGVVLNERAAALMELDDPIGAEVNVWGLDVRVVGVVEDFHMGSFYSPIEPTVLLLQPDETWILVTRVIPGQTEAALASLEAAHKAFNPDYPFDYQFLDASFEQAYRSEAVMGTLLRVFAVVALFVAGLGLLGLVAFTTEQRRKEIGVRKVLGASVPNLVGLLTRDFVALVAVAFVLAAPVAYVGVSRWLDGFAYRVGFGPAPFVLAGLLLLTVALATVGTQALRAATADPVRALRSD
ncbi:MAG: ABC transporter permease [Bacteroidota bacterium]